MSVNPRDSGEGLEYRSRGMRPIHLNSDDWASLAALVRQRAQGLARPYVVAIDGRSGAGKSTLGAKLAAALAGSLLDGDDFFAGGVEVRRDAAETRARDCIDWRRQRPVLEALRAGLPASYRAFDWSAFDGRLQAEQSHVEPRPIIVFAGVYSARPELADLVDQRVLLSVHDETRLARLIAREGHIGAWERQWHEAEDWYFAHAAPRARFDVILEG